MNWKSIKYIFSFFILGMILLGCASTGRPSGGPKDTDAPEFVQEKSSPNFSTNYTPQKVELYFNEWIELKNQAKEILISPPFFKKPKITQRGKRVTVEFPEDEPLRPDATYTINFGKSIVDFTEANPAEGFKFLFATGDKIDSLTLGGSIVDAFGGEPIEEVLIMLYDMLGDSVVKYEKPFYYTRADKDGKFKFENVKNDTFKLVVIEDLNLNYLLDDETERLAFMDSTFVLHDSASYNPELRLFQPEQSVRIINSSSKKAGLITTTFNQASENAVISYLYPSDFNPTVEYSGDTVKFWYAEPYDSVGIIYGLDTLDFTLPSLDSTFYSRKLRINDNNLSSNRLAPFDSLILAFSSPLASIDTSLITLSDRPKEIRVDTISSLRSDSILNVQMDSLAIIDTLQITSSADTIQTPSIDTILTSAIDTMRTASFDTIDSIMNESLTDTVLFYEFTSELSVRSLIINTSWQEDHDYRLTILPNGVTDIYGRTCDTINFDFKTTNRAQYGSIKMTVSGLDSTYHYILLLNDGDKKIREAVINEQEIQSIHFKRLPVSTYNAHLIQDENLDGKWTTGDYWLGRQPELLKKFELEKLREDWDLEAKISWTGEVSDTMGVGVDSTLTRIDTLRQDKILDSRNPPSSPERKESQKEKGNNKGIKGRND